MKIVHISDLHFGTEIPEIVETLKGALNRLSPDLVVASGDFTQHGTQKEFETARDFLNNLGAPVFCVPGNHDVPQINVLQRLLNPYSLYKNYIAPDLNPFFENDTICMAGLNSARRALPHWNWANGAISSRQCKLIARRFSGTAAEKYKICVLHHPPQEAEDSPLKVTLFGRNNIKKTFVETGTDIVLTGHVHHASIDKMDNVVYVSASTAFSRRTRMQNNGFNYLEVLPHGISIHHYILQNGEFIDTGGVQYKKDY